MHAIKSTIFEPLHNCENVKSYVTTHNDVKNAVYHFKIGKSDGSESIFSDNFLHATHHFTLFCLFYTPSFYRMVLVQIQLLWGQ